MRIKAVLRDANILKMTPGSRKRVLAIVEKNLDRPVNWRSMLKVMGLEGEDRTKMLEILKEHPIHIFLAEVMEQNVIFLSKEEKPNELNVPYFKWQ
ncbi:hypothetical protein EU537_09800 [Candidatus Thorarchaeota archaeon]|nr:MAG: hypothetical protein EU537_09800 [Candidatus Thorarchaeota archaeon]